VPGKPKFLWWGKNYMKRNTTLHFPVRLCVSQRPEVGQLHYFSTNPGACLPQCHKSLPLLQVGHLEATIYPQHREYGQLLICSEYNMPEE